MTVTHLPNGFNMLSETQGIASFPYPAPTEIDLYYEDFFSFTEDDWTITQTGNNSTTEIINADCGIAQIILATSANPQIINIKTGEFISPVESPRREIWFDCRAALGGGSGDPTEGQIILGFLSQDSTSRFYVAKQEGSADFRLVTRRASTGNTMTTDTMYNLQTEEFVRYSFHYDGANTISYFIDGTPVGEVDITGSSAFPYDEHMSIVFALRQSAGGATNPAKTLDVDYLLAAQSPRYV